MISKPLFKNFAPEVYKVILLSTIVLMYICVCAEGDIYVPAFPQMITYFNVAENEIQLVLSVNFIGLCLASFIVGPLSDSYGRRKVLLAGLLLFMVSSIVLVNINEFKCLLFWRFIQGISAAVPMICGCVMVFDRYSGDKASQLIAGLNSIITAAVAAAPIAGSYLSNIFGWRANFMVVMILSIITFFSFLLCIEETLEDKLKRKLNVISVFKDYLKILSSLPFICYVLIACFPFITIMVYITNLSVIFINHLGINLEDYSYYQASTMGTFVLFSLASVRLIEKKGLDFTKDVGGILAFIGAFGLFVVSMVDHTSAIAICICMAILSAGGSMMAGTFGVKALSIFPEMNGIATAACTAIRLFMISIFVLLSEIYFNGTIVPIALIIFGYTLFVTIFYGWLHFTRKPATSEL